MTSAVSVSPDPCKCRNLVRLESYARVHHLTSVVTGQLKAGTTWVDLLEASWPGGSITGAPKLRACQRLQELEPLGRGPYCGSILHIDWDGRLDSNILIRTLLRKDADPARACRLRHRRRLGSRRRSRRIGLENCCRCWRRSHDPCSTGVA